MPRQQAETPAPATAGLSPVEVERPIVFFDGVCGLCAHSVDFVIRHDRQQQFLFAPLQGETARARLQQLSDTSLSSMVLLDRTREYRRSDAAWRVLVLLGGVWRIVGYGLRMIPRPLRNWGYSIIARNRYRWFGRKEACRLPTPAERGRFLP